MKPSTWILIIPILFGSVTTAKAQLWRYLNYDPKTEKTFEKYLNREACSVITRSEIIYGEKSYYKVRTYCLQSFDGTHRKITLSERLHGHMLLVEGPKDSMKVEEIVSLIKVHFLRPELLEVVYRPRGGSDQGFDYVLILGLNKGSLCVVAEFLTLNESTMPDEYNQHEVRLKIQGQTLHDCTLTLNVRDFLRSSANRSRSYDRKRVFTLKFDEDRKIFYNKIEYLNSFFKIDSSAGKNRLFSGDYPMIDLGDDEAYCYFDNRWHELVKDENGKMCIMSRIH